MIKYIKKENDKGSYLVKFNTDTQNVDVLAAANTNIDWLWVIDEDGEFNGTPVSTGDLVILMYPFNSRLDGPAELLVIKDETLRDFYKRLTEYGKQRREELSKETVGEKCCDQA